MSEEEEKAVEELKEFISPDTEIKAISMENIKIIYNLIEKQQKEIENSVSKDKIEKLEKKYARRCAILHRNATADQWYSMGKNIGRTEAYQELLEGVDSI